VVRTVFESVTFDHSDISPVLTLYLDIHWFNSHLSPSYKGLQAGDRIT